MLNIVTVVSTVTMLVAGMLPLVEPASAAVSPQAAASCSVDYHIRDDWGTGCTVDVEIINNSDYRVKGWTLNWRFPGNQTINESVGRGFQSGRSACVRQQPGLESEDRRQRRQRQLRFCGGLFRRQRHSDQLLPERPDLHHRDTAGTCSAANRSTHRAANRDAGTCAHRPADPHRPNAGARSDRQPTAGD